MQYRVYTGDDGQSHIEEFELSDADYFHFPMIDDESPIPGHGAGIVFRRKPMPGWHTCPRRQFVLVISGAMELGFGDGSTQRIEPGDICLMEDYTGQGHTTTVVEEPWLSIQIGVSPDAQVIAGRGVRS